MRKSIILLLLLTMVFTACTDLAGEPEIVGQLPTQAPVSVANIEPPAIEADMALGAQVYAENCTRCHGLVGAGDGEFVLSGQITDIPDFTNPLQHESNSPADYYTQVTNGNLEKLMPPFAGSLSDEERWAVANYVMTLAGDTLPETTIATSSQDENTVEVAPVHSTTDEVPSTGTINGAILQGTAGAAIPTDGIVTLSIVQMTGQRSTIETELFSDGTYQFLDVPLVHDAGYFVSIDYGNGTFSSEFASLTAASPEINLNITIYETTDDDSVIQLEVVLAQIDLIDENTLQIWQLISVVNTSDKVYIYEDDRGEAVSVEVPAPSGVSLSPNIDTGRFVFNNSSVFDTRPVVPNTDHSFHLMYTMPLNDKTTFRQTFPYDFFGPYEAYVDTDALRIESVGWQALDDEQTLEGVTYEGIVRQGLTSSQTIEFTIYRKTNVWNRQILGYLVITAGLVLIVVAGVFYWRSPSAPTDSPDTKESLMQAIVALDEQIERGDISQADYEQQRNALKAQLKALL